MPCAIVVTGISGQEPVPGQGIGVLTVRGTAVECGAVCVTVRNNGTLGGGPVLQEKVATVNADGNWSATYRADADELRRGEFVCGAGNDYSVRAYCCADPECVALTSLDGRSIDCDDPEGCPTIAWAASIAALCDANGTRGAQVIATITAASGVSYSAQLRGPDGGILASGSSQNGALTLTSATIQLAPGNYVYQVILNGLPAACRDSNDSNTFTIPPCAGGPPPPDDGPGDDDPNGPGNDVPDEGGDGTGAPESFGCAALRIAGLALLIVGLVLIFGGMCSGSVPAAVIGGILAAIGVGLLLLWAIICAPEVGCLVALVARGLNLEPSSHAIMRASVM